MQLIQREKERRLSLRCQTRDFVLELDGLADSGLADNDNVRLLVQVAPRVADQRAAALANWFFLRHVLPGSPSTATAETVLANLGLMETAEAGVAQMALVLSDKVALTNAWFGVAGIDRGPADFEYIDSRAGTTRRIPMVPPAG
ncbi:hypothetical protein LRH25_20300 [Ideonella azotifigens]|uniref:Uncharacterized protein n=1 Tax=Ideonella azotifigens TaxID=513160 RepID=A0ABP3V739_9BURK|nr:hypothetical protein [Ideonella azotifigens]MCD2342672.1 hypothetical protein [Ideonella azotifigens]